MIFKMNRNLSVLPTHLFFRQQIYVKYSDSQKSNFLQNVSLVLVSVRVRQAVYNSSSFLQSFECRNNFPV